MVKKRGFLTQCIRHLVQLAAFILFPGLFITVFSAVRDLVKAFAEGQFSFGGLFPQIILVFIIAGVWILALPVDSSFSPWGVFGMLVSGNLSVISKAIPTVGFVLLLSIAAGSLFVERFFCRYLCPLGALFAVASGRRLYKVRRRGDTCTNCGLCTRACSMGIHVPEKDAVESGECIQCMQCLAVCPRESLSANPAGAIAGTAAASAIGGTVVVGNLVSSSDSETMLDRPVTERVEIEEQADVGEKTEQAEKGNFTDGVYTGAGEGFRGTIQVQVTVEDGYIADIAVLSFQDDREFFQKAQSAVINDILAEQTSDVDAVSGATFSSNGIMDAVADALGSGTGESEQPADNGRDDDAGGENGSEPGQQEADGESGSGSGQQGAGQGNGSGAGNQGKGRHGKGWRGGSGGGGHRGIR